MTPIILLSTILEFALLVTDGFMEENGLTPSPKKGIRSPQYRSSPRNLKFSQPLRKKFLAPTKKYIFVVGGLYGMENKDTNTD